MNMKGGAMPKPALDVDHDLSELRSSAAKLARERYAPKAAEWDLNRTSFPHDERRYLGDLGYLGITLPEEYGGAGAPLAHALVVIEELAKQCRPAAFQVFESNTGPAKVIALMGTDYQKKQFLPQIASGEKTMAVAISEPHAGSAATDMTTKATCVNGAVTVSGMKRWISNGGEADVYLVYCRMSEALGSKAIGAVLVEADREGVSYGAGEKLMGFRGIPSADIFFDDVVVPEENVVVGAGGFKDLFGAFSIERLGNTTMSLAIGQEALDRTIDYVQERTQFGKPLVEFQAVQMTLADMILAVDAARLLLDRAVANICDGLPNSLEVSLAKCTANEMAKKVTDMAMQLHGGNGYTEEFGLERLHRDSHGWALAGGTPTMQRTRIVSELLGRSFNQRA